MGNESCNSRENVKTCFQEIHDGHVGIVKTKALSRSFVWWPEIDAELEALAKHCEGCLLHKTKS